MRSRSLSALVFIAAVVAGARRLEAQCVAVISTGYDQEAGAVLLEGESDAEYEVADPLGSVTVPVTGGAGAFPIPPWIANSEDSLWISPTASAVATPGDYVYTVRVEVGDDVDPSRLALIGRWATDDPGIDVFVNGTATGIGAGGFTAWTDFPPDAGAGLFQEGMNTVDFVVQNAGVDPNPTGLRVEGCVGIGGFDRRDLSSGISARGFGPLPGGAEDERYVVTGPGDDGPERPAVVLGSPDPSWAENSETSQWIGLDGDRSEGGAGTYRYDVRFDLPAELNPGRVVLSGTWAAAGKGADVIVNGVSQGAVTDSAASLNPLPEQLGLGDFVAGSNVVEFVVENETAGPTALRVEGRLDLVTSATPLDISTGFDRTLGRTLDEGEADPWYAVTDPFLGDDQALAVFGAPTWLADTESSRWIGPPGAAVAPPGVFRYATTVTIESDDDAVGAFIRGVWAADDAGVDVVINDVSTGHVTVAGFGGFTQFPADFGKGLFARGENLIEFFVENGGNAGNPTGLRVDAVVVPGGASPVDLVLLRADANNDGRVNIADPQFTLNRLFLGGPPHPCEAQADANGDGRVNIADAQYELNHLFLGGPAPPEPFPTCEATDRESDAELGCEEGQCG